MLDKNLEERKVVALESQADYLRKIDIRLFFIMCMFGGLIGLRLVSIVMG